MDAGKVPINFSKGEYTDLLSYEEKSYKLDTSLRRMNKFIQPVKRNGLYILQSVQVAYHAVGVECNVHGLKEALRHEIIENIEFYQQFSTASVDMIREMNSFLENPEKYYASDTVHLFLYAIKGKVFQINSQGNIMEINVGLLADYTYEFFFARYGV